MHALTGQRRVDLHFTQGQASLLSWNSHKHVLAINRWTTVERLSFAWGYTESASTKLIEGPA